MSALKALQVAVELAERRRDAARKALLDQQRTQQAAQQQLDQLQGYAEETQDRWGLRENAQVEPEVMRHHYRFMARLEHAIGLQVQVVAQQQARVDQARQVLRETELRLESLRKVVQRRREELAHQAQRREQKETDERAAQRLGRHGLGASIEE